MRSQLLLTSLLLSFLAAACVPAKKQENLDGAQANGIVGGNEVASDDEIPNSIVGVYDAQVGQLCTGTLISRNVVLTAAHCVGSDTSKMYIMFGKNLDNHPAFAQVDKSEISPYYDTNEFKNNDPGDLALLHFPGIPPSGYKVAPLLPIEQAEVLVDTAQVVVAGFGVTNGKTMEGAKILRKAFVTIANSTFSRSEILVDQRAGSGACHGDSGGPAFIKVENQYYLWGVTSRGIQDDDDSCTAFSSYTSSVFHRTWINRMNTKLSSALVNFNRTIR